jgi:hypothetical protein
MFRSSDESSFSLFNPIVRDGILWKEKAMEEIQRGISLSHSFLISPHFAHVFFGSRQ